MQIRLTTLWVQLALLGSLAGTVAAFPQDPDAIIESESWGARGLGAIELPSDQLHRLYARVPKKTGKKATTGQPGAGGMMDCDGDGKPDKPLAAPKKSTTTPRKKAGTTRKKASGSRKSGVRKRTNDPPATPAKQGSKPPKTPGAPKGDRNPPSGGGPNLGTPIKSGGSCSLEDRFFCGLDFNNYQYWGLKKGITTVDDLEAALANARIDAPGAEDTEDVDSRMVYQKLIDFTEERVPLEDWDFEDGPGPSKEPLYKGALDRNKEKRFADRNGKWVCNDAGKTSNAAKGYHVSVRDHPKIDDIQKMGLAKYMVGFFGDFGQGAVNSCLLDDNPSATGRSSNPGKLIGAEPTSRWGLADLGNQLDDANMSFQKYGKLGDPRNYQTEHIYEANWIRAFWLWLAEDDKSLTCAQVEEMVFESISRKFPAGHTRALGARGRQLIINGMADELGNWWHLDRLASLDGPVNALKYRVFAVVQLNKPRLIIAPDASKAQASEVTKRIWDPKNAIIFPITQLRKMMMVIEYMRDDKVERAFMKTVEAMDEILADAQPAFTAQRMNVDLVKKHHEFLKIMIDEANCAVAVTAVTIADKIVEDPRWKDFYAASKAKGNPVAADIEQLVTLSKVPLARLQTDCKWTDATGRHETGYRKLSAPAVASLRNLFVPWNPARL